SQYVRPRLTTIRSPVERLAQTGVALLFDRMAGTAGPAKIEVLPVELIVRESAGPPGAATAAAARPGTALPGSPMASPPPSPFPRASRAERGHLMRVLLCGESWVTHSLHIKGVDSFSTSSYVEGAGHLRAALAGADIEVDYLPGHLVPGQFPATLGDLLDYQ